MIRRLLTIVAAAGVLVSGAAFALSSSHNAVAPTEGLRFLIDLQETHSDITARWFYTEQPEYTTWYEFWVEDEAAQAEVIHDSTSLKEVTFTIQRADVDKAYRFYVKVWIEDATGTKAQSSPYDDRFIIPAAPAAGLLAKRDMVTSPVIVNNDPAFEQPRGTVWLEFETTADITTSQGLWSRDANGYENGGHLSVYVQNGSVWARLQSDSASYTLQWPVVPSTLNQVAIEFGEDTGFRLWVNSALAMSDPYTGGTQGNSNDLVVGADKMGYRPDGSTPEYANPFAGTVRVSEFYLGRYDFSGRWGLPPLPPPPPVDSLVIEASTIDHGQVEPLVDYNGQPTAVDYFTVRFTPIQEAEYIVRFVDGDTLDHQGVWKEAKLPVAGADWVVVCSGACKADTSWRGWEMFNTRTGARCSAPVSGWTTNGTAPCVTKAEIIARNERNPDCVGGRYWAKHDSEIECNFNIKSALRTSFVFPRGTNPTLRFEVFDADRRRIGYWERRVS
jgi:hypothetical protein